MKWFLLLSLITCAHSADDMTGSNCPTPETKGEVGHLEKYHKGCKERFGESACATRIEYKKEIQHTSVTCTKMERRPRRGD
jgi:hypothetical protein